MSVTLLEEAHGFVRERIRREVPPEKLRDDLQQPLLDLMQLLRQTADYGESNSALIVGPAGSGKTELLKQALHDLKKDRTIADNLIEVHLDGILQTDDRITLAEITRQLQLENTVGDKVFGSFSENLAFLLEALRDGESKSSRPILFILEEFDLFTLHKNQTLLYNLFDITQAGKSPVAVIGLTCRLDIMDLFEKRVKSRFSHRQIYVCNSWDFDEYVQILKNNLSLPNNFSKTTSVSKSDKQRFIKNWNGCISKMVEDPSVRDQLETQFSICKEIAPLYTILALPLSRLNPLEDVDNINCNIAKTISTSQADSNTKILQGLPILDLCLVIAMDRLANTRNEPFNFQMIYNEFLKFAKHRSHILQNCSKAVVMKAFERLSEVELVKPFDGSLLSVCRGSNSKLQKEYWPLSLLVEQSQLHNALRQHQGCPTEIKQWATTSVL